MEGPGPTILHALIVALHGYNFVEGSFFLLKTRLIGLFNCCYYSGPRTVIVLEHSRYNVAEDAGYLDVCAEIQENGAILSGLVVVEMKTAEGGKS